ncbi:MAG TPA: 1,4-alpha-glucan branching protein GlgB [Woeseiaceae bacterium]|nr:1,4-alpha-glucan branching protein GlgB [Woeseiaceae bacterium]
MNNKLADSGALEKIVAGTFSDPFAVLGIHEQNGQRILRTFQPQAKQVRLLNKAGKTLSTLTQVDGAGMFETPVPARLRHYRIGITKYDGYEYTIEDPYRFPATLGELDHYYLKEGSHQQIHAALGAHCTKLLGVAGVRFAVWAPNALRVSVIGPFNDWDGRRHVMRCNVDSGIWDIFVPGIGPGEFYKFELLDQAGRLLPLKADPMANFVEAPPGNASIVYESSYQWQDQDWLARNRGTPRLDRPVSIYEVHAGSWRRGDGGRVLSYRELADTLVPYLRELGFTHIELMPITEYPFEGSWGYQPIGLYAPTHRFGTPDDFRHFVDCCHQAGIAVVIDWVAAHFPRDAHGLARFDGTALYEHEDPRLGEHADWQTLIFNYGRREVINYLLGSALYWVDEFHIDGLRVDAVASMLYLDYSRKPGEWVPNRKGGNENLEAIDFLQRLNEQLHAHGAQTFAEESTAWPGVSRPVYDGGLGFTYKWNMGWMNDTLRYMREDPVNRKYHHSKMTFGLLYANQENFVLPLSHDEVVHEKRSILGRMPGDAWQQFANLRAYYGFMYCHPGKKLLFMGDEFGQSAEWNHDTSLDWHQLADERHAGTQALVRDLNRLYSSTPALYELDFSNDGFQWIECDAADNSVFAFLRYDASRCFVVCVSNFTPVTRHNYLIGVPKPGRYSERINSDATEYAGSGLGNLGTVVTSEQAAHGYAVSLSLTLPPLATIILAPFAQQAI